MSGPPYALQRLAAILNFSGGRSSAFMLHHLLEHDDGHLVAAALAAISCNQARRSRRMTTSVAAFLRWRMFLTPSVR